ncbi:acyl carrier protein [Amycolatopsis australiensis]|uniref:Acyl carrier protein n=1 Tax=Amycolatopsis australiensis TaxID=546364 RepID=A0A1K1S2Z2_9PSEU|nr:acyl carrier protein [Amycolatopsis australiensis]SFW78670.1 acyl carrier protein [Amycolatopsis australiensis]
MNDQATQAVVGYLVEAITTRLENVDLPADPVTGDSAFEDLGLDSINLVELALLVERELRVVVTDAQLAEWGTVGAAGAHIAASVTDSSVVPQPANPGGAS